MEKTFVDIYGNKIRVEEGEKDIAIYICTKEGYSMVVMNKYWGNQLGKFIVNATGGIKL